MGGGGWGGDLLPLVSVRIVFGYIFSPFDPLFPESYSFVYIQGYFKYGIFSYNSLIGVIVKWGFLQSEGLSFRLGFFFLSSALTMIVGFFLLLYPFPLLSGVGILLSRRLADT